MANPFDDAITADLPAMMIALGAKDATYIDELLAETTVSALLELGVSDYPTEMESTITQRFDRISLMLSQISNPRVRDNVRIGDDIYRLDKLISNDGFVAKFVVVKKRDSD